MNEYLDNLQNIKKVDAPPYLLTRIHQKIRNELQDKISSKMALALGLSFFLLVIINAYALSHSTRISMSDRSNDIQTLQLMPENSFYK